MTEPLDILRANQTLGNDPRLTHPQVPLQRNGQEVWVDEGLEKLIRHLWGLGIDTVGSCQNVAEWWAHDPEAQPLAMVAMPVADYGRWCSMIGAKTGDIDPDTVACRVFFTLTDRGATPVVNDDDSIFIDTISAEDVESGRSS